MIPTVFDFPADRSPKVLCLGAHCDDIEIGCGGTLLELCRRRREVDVRWVIFAADDERKKESQSAASAVHGSSCVPTFHAFRDGYFPGAYTEIKEQFEDLKIQFDPDLIFTHYQYDHHQDHRVISELTWSTFRSHSILEYEIPKYDGDLGKPSVFMPLARDVGIRKSKLIVESNISQRKKRWFTEDTFLSLLRLRGIQCNAPDGYAEAFYSKKSVISLENL